MAGTYQRQGVGLGAVLQQHVDHVRVSLLRRLVQRRVAVLRRNEPVS